MNLYFNARNAMLFKILRHPEQARRVPANQLAILRITSAVLDVEGVVITDINAAATEQPRWFSLADGLEVLDHDEIFATSWNHADYWEKRRHMQRMMAEVLVPNRVPPEMILGAYVNAAATAANLSVVAPTLETEVNSYMFFEGPKP